MIQGSWDNHRVPTSQGCHKIAIQEYWAAILSQSQGDRTMIVQQPWDETTLCRFSLTQATGPSWTSFLSPRFLFQIPSQPTTHAEVWSCRLPKTTQQSQFWCKRGNYLRAFYTASYRLLPLIIFFLFFIQKNQIQHNMSLDVRKPVFCVFDQVRYKPGCTASQGR